MSLIEKAADKLKKKAPSLSGQPDAYVRKKSPEVSRNAHSDTASVADSVAEKTTSGVKQNLAPTEKVAEESIRVNIDLDLLHKKNIQTNDDTTHSVTTEEFRIVKRSLLLNAFSKGDAAIKNGNIILVTSTQPDEGKTFCAVSLAMSMAAERDLTVLLVDADVSKPDVLNILGIKGDKGLMDVIENKDMDLRECLLKTNIPNLTILPAGKKHKLTTELLASGRMGEIIDEIARRYRDRVIIIDSPPVLASSAASVLALHVGQILYVVEAERTRKEELSDALKMIEKGKNINMLLNKARYSVGKKKFGSYYGYGNN